MMPMMPMKHDKIIAHLEEKGRLLQSLCDAVRDWLSADDRFRLKSLQETMPEESLYSEVPNLRADEDLVQATADVQSYQEQLEQLESLAQSDSPIAEAMRPMINGMMVPMIRRQLHEAERYRDQLQRAIERAPIPVQEGEE